SRYLARHTAHPSIRQWEWMHKEIRELPEYTPEGERTAERANIVHIPDVHDMVDRSMGTLYHRLPMLHPDLKSIGFGYTTLANGGVWAVMDVLSGRKTRRDP